jgi:predicted nuclease of predicted toxin-antitoxin system
VKFILDAQLLKSLCILLNQKGFDAIHTLDLPNRNKTSDEDILKFALQEDRIVVTKDQDFLESFLVRSIPKKLIILRTGNISNSMLLSIFENNLSLIITMINRSNLIEIHKTEIAEHD